MYHLRHIPSEAKIRKHLKHILFGKHVFCPTCCSYKVTRYEVRYRCKKCRDKFSLLSHTWLSNIKLPLTQFWLVLWCWTKQVPVTQTISLSGLSKKGIRYWYEAFRSNLPKHRELLEAIVQLDEAYFGGWKGWRLILAKQQGTRRLAYKLLPQDPLRVDALNFLKEAVKPGSTLYTDGNSIYRDIGKHFPVAHCWKEHKEWEFKLTSEVEGTFGNLRTFIRRMYHHVTPQKFPEVLCEFYWRFCSPEMFQSPRNFLTKTLYLVPTGY